jgi:ATP-binding cassette subfamily B protein
VKEIFRLFSYAKGLNRYVLIVGIASGVLALLSMATPFIIKLATDDIVAVVGGRDLNQWYLLGLVGILAIVSVIGALLSDWSGYIGDMLAVRLRRQLSQRYYEHLLKLPQTYYDEAVTGKVINRLNRAIADVTRFINIFSNNFLQMLLVIVIAVAIMAWYSPWIALVILLQIPAYIAITAHTSKKWQRYEKKINEHFDIASGRFAEVVSQIRLVKSFGSGPRELTSFGSRYKKIVNLTNKQSRYWHTMNFWRMLVQTAVYSAVFAILFMSAGTRAISLGDMALLIALVQQTTTPLQNISFYIDMYQRAIANSRDYAEAMNEKPEEESEATRTLETSDSTIEYRGVTFAYSNKKQVLQNVSFKVGRGEKVALVGESGGGKSTIANLLMRLYEPSSGAITIGGVPVAEVAREEVRARISTVFQDAGLFSGTIRENIAYGRPEASEEEIVKAAKAANAHEFIVDFDKGYDTEIGERGIKLSGGQKQRMAIARAILKDAPILILDEATSALDSRSETVVQEALERLMKGRTVLIIAHRLSTIASVDTIVTLKKGHVDEVGSPSELAATGGIYAQLLELQLGTTKAAKERLKRFDIA